MSLILLVLLLLVVVIVVLWFLLSGSSPSKPSEYQMDIEAQMRKQKTMHQMRDYVKSKRQ